jgi:predicted ester cyclase
VSEWLTAFPDTVSVVRDIIAEGDRVAARWTTQATHRGEFMVVPPTGKSIHVTWFGIFHLSGGRIVESWDTFNVVEMMRQLRR